MTLAQIKAYGPTTITNSPFIIITQPES